MIDNWSLALGAFGAATGSTAIVFAVVHLRELRTTHRETATVRTETLAALDLHKILVTDPLLSEGVRDIGGAYARVHAEADPFFCRLVSRELAAAQRRIHGASGGRLAVSEEEITGPVTYAGLLLGLADEGDEFWASSLVSPTFWKTATSYLEQNREQRARGVLITRVFIFGSIDAFRDKEAQRQMTRQLNATIDVRYAIDPDFEARDLVVLKKRSAEAVLEDRYAGECLLRADKSIANIDIWSSTSYPDKVTELRRILVTMLEYSHQFTPEEVSIPGELSEDILGSAAQLVEAMADASAGNGAERPVEDTDDTPEAKS